MAGLRPGRPTRRTRRRGSPGLGRRKDLRWILVEAARIAVLYHEHWKREYARLEKRLGPNKAIVVIARKLLVVVWHVLTERAADRHVAPEMVAYKLMAWSWKLDDQQRGGMTTRQFVRYHLMQLNIGDDLTEVRHEKNRVRPLASVDEVLALHPELKPID